MLKIKIIAEIGWNHMGDMNLAKEMIKAAAGSGADYVKFQTWSEKNLKSGPWDHDGRREIYKKAELSEKNHYYLLSICKDCKVGFLTSVFNVNSLEFLKDLGLKMIKIPSHEVYNKELIKKSDQYFEKVIVSTGAAKWDEIKAIPTLIDKKKLILMHCVSSYPCSAEDVNLPRISSLKELSNEVGYSGHFPGIDDAMASMSFGISYIEKHFTTDQNLPGRDNKYAILPDDLKYLTQYRNNFELMIQDKGLNLQKSEEDTYHNYRNRWGNK